MRNCAFFRPRWDSWFATWSVKLRRIVFSKTLLLGVHLGQLNAIANRVLPVEDFCRQPRRLNRQSRIENRKWSWSRQAAASAKATARQGAPALQHSDVSLSFSLLHTFHQAAAAKPRRLARVEHQVFSQVGSCSPRGSGRPRFQLICL